MPDNNIEENPSYTVFQNQNQGDHAIFLSLVTSWGLNRVVAVGKERPLQLDDLCKLNNTDSVWSLCSAFEQHRRDYGKNHKRLYQEGSNGSAKDRLLFPGLANAGSSLAYALWMTFRPALLTVTLLRLSADLLDLLGPLSLRWIILFQEGQPVFDWAGYTYALASLGAVGCHALVQQLLETRSRLTAADARAVLTDALHRKARSCRSEPLADTLAPLQEDVKRVEELVVRLWCVWSSPLRVALCLGFLWRELGPCTLVGVTLLLLLIPVNSAVQRRVKLLLRSQMEAKEETEKLLKEMLHGIKMLKFLTWEAWYQHRVIVARKRELEVLRILGFLTAFSMLSPICVPFLVSLCSLGVLVLLDDGNVLTASQVFASLCFFRLLRPSFEDLPVISSLLQQCKQSLCRLEEFFLTEDEDTNGVHLGTAQEQPSPSRSPNHQATENEKRSEINLGVEPQTTPTAGGVALGPYLRAFGWHRVLLFSLLLLGGAALCMAQDALLCVWTDEAKEMQGLEEWRELRGSRLSAYALLGLLQALLISCAAGLLTVGSRRASASLHRELLSSVLRLPLTTIYSSRSTQLLNCFTQDLDVIDRQLPESLQAWLSSALALTGTALLIALVLPALGLPLAPLALLVFSVQSSYTSTSRQIRSLEADCSSAVESLMCGGIAGPASSQREIALGTWPRALQRHLLCHANSILLDGWLALRLDALSGILFLLTTFALLERYSSLESGVVALLLMHAMNARTALHLYTRSCCDLYTQTPPLQRVSHYTSMEKEAPWTRAVGLDPDWPQGQIEFRQFENQPCPSLVPAFKALTFCISKGEKVGVLSRQQANIKGLVSCLFRAVEAKAGVILIDGTDIASVGLHDLRLVLQLIPQVPELFTGTLRANLDPGGRHPDSQVWRALELARLKEWVRLLPGQLLHPARRGPLALSLGHRRLLWVARALLKKARILLVEDPVSSGDPEAERLLQQVIWREFSDSTVLSLTQNPYAVMHTDRVLVLDSGRVVEFDSPANLLQQGALFSQLSRERLRGDGC